MRNMNKTNFDGEALTEFMRRQKVTRAELSEAIGMKSTYLSNAIGQFGYMPTVSWVALCATLGIPTNMFATDTPKPFVLFKPKSNDEVVEPATERTDRIADAIAALIGKLDLLATQNEEIIGLLDAIRKDWGTGVER